MAGSHAVAAIVEDTAGQKSLGFHPFGLVVGDLLIHPRLDGIEQSPIQNGGLLAIEAFAFESNFANIEAIAEKLREGAPRKRYAANTLACLQFTDLSSTKSW